METVQNDIDEKSWENRLKYEICNHRNRDEIRYFGDRDQDSQKWSSKRVSWSHSWWAGLL